MKLRLFLPIIAILAWSCNDPETHNGSSTPIDSTNLEGTAPATYGADDPADPDAPRYDGRFDTSIRANTSSEADSIY